MGMSQSGDPWSQIQKTFILDACFSGGFWNGNDSDGTGDLKSLPLTRLIASSSEDQLTWAPFIALGTPYSLLTDRYLEDGLMDKEARAAALENHNA